MISSIVRLYTKHSVTSTEEAINYNTKAVNFINKLSQLQIETINTCQYSSPPLLKKIKDLIKLHVEYILLEALPPTDI